MARVNITLPDNLVRQARAAGLNVSRVAAAALGEELDRQAKIAALNTYLEELDEELGPVPEDESRAAREWADRAFAPVAEPRAPADARPSRSA